MKIRGIPVINVEKCFGCGACKHICPVDAINLITEHDKLKISIFYGRCIRCGRCSDVCPNKAIEITEKYMIITNRKEDLYYIVEIPIQKCLMCNQIYSTNKQIEYVINKLSQYVSNYINICSKCRVVKEFSEVIKHD